MKISLKYFALGAIMASFPVFFYIKLNLGFSNNSELGVLTYKSKNLSSLAVDQSLKPEVKAIIPIPTLNPSPQQVVNSLVIVETASEETPAPSLEAKQSIEESPKPTPTQVTQQHQMASYTKNHLPAPEEIYLLIDKYANYYQVSKNMMLIIAKCESGYNEEAANGPYAGIYQFLASTWISNRNAMEEDPNPKLRFNAEEAVKTAAFKMSRDGFTAWPVCSQKAKMQLSLSN